MKEEQPTAGIRPDGVARTCTASELERCTEQGWVLREIVSMQRQDQGLRYSTNETNNGGYAQYMDKQGPPVVVTEPLFVLVRSHSEELQRLRKDLAKKENALRDAEMSAKIDAKIIVGAGETASGLKREKDEATRDRNLWHERFTTSEGLRQKLEVDLGKLRKEIGEARFREIVVDKKEGEA